MTKAGCFLLLIGILFLDILKSGIKLVGLAFIVGAVTILMFNLKDTKITGII